MTVGGPLWTCSWGSLLPLNIPMRMCTEPPPASESLSPNLRDVERESAPGLFFIDGLRANDVARDSPPLSLRATLLCLMSARGFSVGAATPELPPTPELEPRAVPDVEGRPTEVLAAWRCLPSEAFCGRRRSLVLLSRLGVLLPTERDDASRPTPA